MDFARDLVDNSCAGGGVMRQAGAPIFRGPMGPGFMGGHQHPDMMEGGDFDPMLMHEGGPAFHDGGGQWQNEFLAHHHHHHHHHHQQHFDPMASEQSWAEQMLVQRGHEAVIPPGPQDGGAGSWLEQFEKQEGEEWVNDYTNEEVANFTVEGELPMTVEEKKANSEFYKFLGKVNDGTIQFDEVNRIVEGPAPEVSSFADEFMRQQQQNMSQFENQEEGFHEDDGEEYEAAWGSDDNEEWLKQYVQSNADGLAPELDEASSWVKDFQKQMDSQGPVIPDEYPFEENNPYMFHDNPFEEGNVLLMAGTLAAAALAFEAACQKDPYHVEAWYLLGTTQQENEKDPLAIIALKKAQTLDPLNLQVYQALSVSFTNEAQHNNALAALKDWLMHHNEYGSIPPPVLDSEEDNELLNDYFYVNPKHHKEVTMMYEEAVRRNPMDADLHIALGVIRNLSHEYDVAASDFEKALQIRPDDAKLWNKLGATLANGSRPREAINAYNRALDIVPGYVRAQYNMGISLSNLGEYADAVRQFLKALHMQQDGVGGSDGPVDPSRGRYTREIWDVMRMTFHLMDRSDLIELTVHNDIKGLAREFGLVLN